MLNRILRRTSSYMNDQPVWAWALIVPVILFSWIKFPARSARDAKLLSSSRCVPVTDQVIRIGSYNIHRAKGIDGIRDLNRVAENLSGLDLVAMQEVAGPLVWAGKNQACRLASHLDCGWVFAPTRYRAFKPDVGNALLSKLSVADWCYQSLPSTNSMRNLLTGTITFGTTEVTVLATHIDRGRDRCQQLSFVLDKFTESRHAILFGDLNTTRRQTPLQEFLNTHPECDAIKKAGGLNPDDRIDWILTRGIEIGRGGNDAIGASDHPLYWLEIKGLKGDVAYTCENFNHKLPVI